MTSDDFTIHDREPDEEPTGGEGGRETSAGEGDGAGERDAEEGTHGRAWSRGVWSDAFADVQEIVNDVVENVRGFPLSGGRYPRLDLYRVGDEGYRVLVDLPGVGRDDVEVTTVGDELTIEGERRRPGRERAELLRSERGYGHFRRSLRMPPDVDPSGVKAEMHEGVLEIRLPRALQAESHRVEID